MNFERFILKKESSAQEKLSGKEDFETKEGDVVTLKWNICKPKQTKEHSSGIVVFLPGVALEADSGSVVESTQDFADASGTLAYAISTRIDNPKTKNSQQAQAEAIKEFLAKNNLREVTVIGHSKGANTGMSLVAQLEKENFTVNGLILTNPASLSNRDPDDLTTNFFKDALVKTPATLLENIKEKKSFKSFKNAAASLRLGNSVTGNIAKEILTSPTEFTTRAGREAEEAATLNKNAKDIKAKIVVVFGEKDIALGAGELIPETAHDQSIKAQQERGEEMRKIFPNSEGVKVIEATKLSNHGLHYVRSKEIAETSLFLLERMQHKQS